MSEPVIGYHSVISATNVTTSSSIVGFPAAALANPLTYDKWRGETNLETIIVDTLFAETVDYLGIAVHNLKYVSLATSNDGFTWSDVGGPWAIAEAALIAFDPISSRYWRITVECEPTLTCSIAALFLGRLLKFERCIMSSYAPLPFNRKTDVTPNISDNGQFLGRTIVRGGYASSVEFNFITAPWAREYFQPFVLHARSKPYFFQWNPELYPDEVAYVWTNDDIGISYTRDRNMMAASWKMEGPELKGGYTQVDPLPALIIGSGFVIPGA